VPRLTDARMENAMDGGMNDPGFRDALSNALDQSQQGIAAPIRTGHCGIRLYKSDARIAGWT
jgi:hypothetical protein